MSCQGKEKKTIPSKYIWSNGQRDGETTEWLSRDKWRWFVCFWISFLCASSSLSNSFCVIQTSGTVWHSCLWVSSRDWGGAGGWVRSHRSLLNHCFSHWSDFTTFAHSFQRSSYPKWQSAQGSVWMGHANLAQLPLVLVLFSYMPPPSWVLSSSPQGSLYYCPDDHLSP